MSWLARVNSLITLETDQIFQEASMPQLELPKNWMPTLEPTSLHISEIAYECATWKVPKVWKHAGYIKFTGTYKHGSMGSGDAKHIDWRINEFCDLAPVSGLIVDFRELDYR